MTQLNVTVDTAKPITVSVLLVDSTKVFIDNKAMKQMFGKEAHLQTTEKSVLACVEDLCVPYSKKSKKNDILEEKGKWYIQLDSFCQTIGRIFRWTEPGKSIEIISIKPKTSESDSSSSSNLAPDFKLSDASGKQIALTDYRGKKVMVSLWASW